MPTKNAQAQPDVETVTPKKSYRERVQLVSSPLPEFTKDTSGYNYKYVTLDAIQKVLTPLCAQYNLFVTHHLSFITVGAEKVFGVVTTVYGTLPEDESAGPPLQSFFPIKHTSSPQDVGSARTYGMRYNVTALFNVILVGEDDDGASASKKSSSKGGGGVSTTKQGTKKSAPASSASDDTDW